METRIHLLLLLSALIGTVLSGACPDENDLGPCACDEYGDDMVDLILSCDASATIEDVKSALRHFADQVHLAVELNEMKLGTLPSDLFDGSYVRTLSISHCELDSLAEEGGRAFSGLEDILEELDIVASFSEDNEPTKLNLGHMRALKKLDLSFNSIDVLGNDWFENGPTSLTQLILSNNGLEEIGDRAFAKLANLEEFWLDGNRFGPISRSMLPNPAERLEDVQLDNNAFTSIPDDLFSNMPALSSLALRNNGIAYLKHSAFSAIWESLYSLDVRGNPINCDSHIEWMFNAKTQANILGTCEAPRNRHGIDLEDLIESKGH